MSEKKINQAKSVVCPNCSLRENCTTCCIDFEKVYVNLNSYVQLRSLSLAPTKADREEALNYWRSDKNCETCIKHRKSLSLLPSEVEQKLPDCDQSRDDDDGQITAYRDGYFKAQQDMIAVGWRKVLSPSTPKGEQG